MSAPDTNVKKQENRHKPALLGIRGAVVFGALMLLLIIVFSIARGGDTSLGEVYDGETDQTGSSVEFDQYKPGTNVTN